MDPAAGPWLAEELGDAVDDGFGKVFGVYARRLLLGLVGGVDLGHVTSINAMGVSRTSQ